jgi:hypothetical protein
MPASARVPLDDVVRRRRRRSFQLSKQAWLIAELVFAVGIAVLSIIVASSAP